MSQLSKNLPSLPVFEPAHTMFASPMLYRCSHRSRSVTSRLLIDRRAWVIWSEDPLVFGNFHPQSVDRCAPNLGIKLLATIRFQRAIARPASLTGTSKTRIFWAGRNQYKFTECVCVLLARPGSCSVADATWAWLFALCALKRVYFKNVMPTFNYES